MTFPRISRRAAVVALAALTATAALAQPSPIVRIGYLTMNAREFLQTDVVLVGILLYALLGKLADVFARGLERYWLRWHPGYQRVSA